MSEPASISGQLYPMRYVEVTDPLLALFIIRHREEGDCDPGELVRHPGGSKTFAGDGIEERWHRVGLGCR